MTVLTLLGLVLGQAFPAAMGLRDRMAVAGARAGVIGVFHRARLEAVARGGAQVVLFTDPARVELRSGGTLLGALDLEAEYGVELILTRNRDRVELSFDALGLGRVSSQTLILSRGAAEARLVVSAYGRVRKG
jgi:hypothetical protein